MADLTNERVREIAAEEPEEFPDSKVTLARLQSILNNERIHLARRVLALEEELYLVKRAAMGGEGFTRVFARGPNWEVALAEAAETYDRMRTRPEGSASS